MKLALPPCALIVGALLAPVAIGQGTDPPAAQPPMDSVTVQYTPPLVMTRPPSPVYPKAARGVSGWVRVECVVSPRGRIESVRIVASEPAGLFDQAAIDAMKKARFKPFKSSQPKLMVQRLIFDPN